MRTRKRNYNSIGKNKDKELNTNVKATNKSKNNPVSNSETIEKKNRNLQSKLKSKKLHTDPKVAEENSTSLSRPKRKKLIDNTEGIEKENYYFQNKTNSKKLKADVNVTEELNQISPSKRKGRNPKDNAEAIKKKNCNLRSKPNGKKLKNDLNVREERKCNPPIKTQGKKLKDYAKITVPKAYNLQNKAKGKKSKVDELIENYNLIDKAKERKLKPDVKLIKKENYSISSKTRSRKSEINTKVTTTKTLKCQSKLKDNVEVLEDEICSSSVKTQGKMSKAENNTEKNQEKNTEIVKEHETKSLNEGLEVQEKKNVNVMDYTDIEIERNDVEMQDASENRNIEILEDDNNDDDHPDEVTFCSSRDNARESLKLMKDEINKIKNEHKEIRKRIHYRNVLQKKQKRDKIAEIQKKKLPLQLLEYVSKLPKDARHDEAKEAKLEQPKSPDIFEDDKCEKLAVPKEEDFISVHGSTEFRACYLDREVKKPKLITSTIAEFKQRAFFGSKNKRESVWELKSKMIKQAVAGKL